MLHGFEYEIVHNGNGHRCGYIKVLPGHPWFGKSYSCDSDEHYEDKPHECTQLNAKVHGGITFADYGTACPTHGEKDEWWVGFDCAHSGDMIDFSLPIEKAERLREIYGDMPRFGGETIKTTDYVRAECEQLALQAATVA